MSDNADYSAEIGWSYREAGTIAFRRTKPERDYVIHSFKNGHCDHKMISTALGGSPGGRVRNFSFDKVEGYLWIEDNNKTHICLFSGGFLLMDKFLYGDGLWNIKALENGSILFDTSMSLDYADVLSFTNEEDAENFSELLSEGRELVLELSISVPFVYREQIGHELKIILSLNCKGFANAAQKL